MFDSTLLEQPSTPFSVGNNALESNNLIFNNSATLGSDTLLNSTSHDRLLPSINLNVDDYISRNLEQATTLNDRLSSDESAFIASLSSMTKAGTEKLSAQIERDPLTGLSADDSLVNNGDRASSLSALSTPNPTNASGTRVVRGNLRANTFTLQTGFSRTVFSGNGNVDFGRGYTDLLNLSNISSSTVRFNWATMNGGGLVYNPGNGARVFDAMTLNNGQQILFEGIDRIRFADRTINLSVRPNDPYFNSQWNLHMMGVHNAWRFTKGSTGVLVGIQDSGLGTDYNNNIHPDLRSTTIYTDNYQDDFLTSDKSHGTAVQGIIAAKTNNGAGMSGINWNSPVFNIDVLDGDFNDLDLAEATQNMINFTNSRGQKLIVNMSLGGGSRDNVFEQLIANNQNNALFVIASGNDNRNSLSYPAWLAYYYNNVIAVGASWGTNDQYGNAKTPGERISYPSFWGSNYGYGITLMGPSEVISTKATNTFFGSSQFGYYNGQYNFQGSLDIFNGTSAATPNVAGVASLVWSANRNLSATQIKAILSQTAFDLGARGYDYVYGSGFANADAAVRRAMAIARLSAGSNSAFTSGNTLALASLNGGTMSSYSADFASASNIKVDLVPTVAQSFDFSRAIASPKDDTTVLASIELQATPVHSANHDAITGLNNAVQLTGVTQKASRLLVAGLDVYSPLGKNADELMLA